METTSTVRIRRPRRTARLLTAAVAASLALGSAVVLATGRGDAPHTGAAATTPITTTGSMGATGEEKIRVPRLFGTSSTAGSGAAVKIRVLHRPGQYVPGQDTGTWSSMYDFLQFVVSDAADYWNGILTAAGYPQSHVNFLFPAPGVLYDTACGTTNDTTMKYCPGDDTIYFSQQVAYDLWTGAFVGPDGENLGQAQAGDLTVAYLVAHEVAHNAQEELGLLERYATPQIEQHADCWAGVWARSAQSRGLLDPNDVQEGLNGAWTAGDSQTWNPQHHGTSQERINAFWTGYSSGYPQACNPYLQ